CHDHKFDPIPTADYYSLAGILHSTALHETVIDSPERERQIASMRSGIKPRDGDIVFKDFEKSGYDGWRVTGQAFGQGPVQGVASSFGGSDRLMGSLTSKTFNMPKLFVHVKMAGSKSDSKLKEIAPLRFTVVANGFKSKHLFPEGSDAPRWYTMRMVLEIGRTCYFEIVDRSAEGHIAVSQIVFSDSEKPPEDGQAIPESIFATVAADEDPRDVRVHIRGNHLSLGDPAPRRFLQVIAGEDQPPIRNGSGRLEIA